MIILSHLFTLVVSLLGLGSEEEEKGGRELLGLGSKEEEEGGMGRLRAMLALEFLESLSPPWHSWQYASPPLPFPHTPILF